MSWALHGRTLLGFSSFPKQQSGPTEAFEEVETIILQPIGRGVQDIDSRVGSMTTLARATGGSLMDGKQTCYSSPTDSSI